LSEQRTHSTMRHCVLEQWAIPRRLSPVDKAAAVRQGGCASSAASGCAGAKDG
jgi:hypothetical protein